MEKRPDWLDQDRRHCRTAAIICNSILLFDSFLFLLVDEETSHERNPDSEDLGEESEEDSKDSEPGQDDKLSSDQDGDTEDDQEREEEISAKEPKYSFQNIDDFEKFTEGMDDVGSSDEEDEDDVSIDEDDVSIEEESEEEESGDENEQDSEDAKASKDDGAVMTFSKGEVAEEVEKGKAVKNQIGLYIEFALCFDEPYTLPTLEKLSMLRTVSAY